MRAALDSSGEVALMISGSKVDTQQPDRLPTMR
jgi:hypothetical protein